MSSPLHPYVADLFGGPRDGEQITVPGTSEGPRASVNVPETRYGGIGEPPQNFIHEYRLIPTPPQRGKHWVYEYVSSYKKRRI